MSVHDNKAIHDTNLPEPDVDLESWLDAARELIDENRLEQAEEVYRWLIGFGVQSEKAFTNLAVICQLRGDLDESLSLLHRALILNPASLQAHLNLANVFEAQGDHQAAISQIKRVLKLDSEYAEAHHNLGFLFGRLKKHSQAIEAYGKALELKPVYPDAYNNLGNALKASGDFGGAMAAYEQAISQKPDFADAHLNRALLLLLLGDYELGWQEYAWRLRRSSRAMGLPHAMPSAEIWDGDPSGQPVSLLLVCEQGLGDSIQLLRYVNILRQQGHRIQLAVQESLHAIIKSSGIDAMLVSLDEADRYHKGYWLPIFSLPALLRVAPDHPVASNPYLYCPSKLVDKWWAILQSERKPIIAINWQGNPAAEQTANVGRSLALELLSPLAVGFEGSFVSIQKGFGSEQLAGCSFIDRFVTCQEQVASAFDFVDIAAIVLNTDLVITTDTCVAHLAGALGHPTWLLLSMVPDWRWGLNGDRSFWYPSVRLFRQSSSGDWAGVIERVKQALQALDPPPEATD